MKSPKNTEAPLEAVIDIIVRFYNPIISSRDAYRTSNTHIIVFYFVYLARFERMSFVYVARFVRSLNNEAKL